MRFRYVWCFFHQSSGSTSYINKLWFRGSSITKRVITEAIALFALVVAFLIAQAIGRLIKGYQKETNNITSEFEAFHVRRSIEGFGPVKG